MPTEKSGNMIDDLNGQASDPNISLKLEEGGVLNSEPQKMTTRRRHRTFSPPVYDSLGDTADQGYMKLFSPVKRKRASKPASLPEKKMENNYNPTDPHLRASVQGSDHRSAISAPQIWEDRTSGDMENNGDQNRAHATALDSFAIFETDAPKETTTAEDSQNSIPDSNGISVFEGISNAPGEQIKVDEATDDGRILSEIRSIRAMFSGKSKGTPQDTSHVMTNLPHKARSAPVSRVNHGIVGDSTIKRSVSAPERKDANDCYSPYELSCGKVHDSQVAIAATCVSRETDVPTQEGSQRKQPEETPVEEDEDIWAAQAITSRNNRRFGRKRKKVPSEEEQDETVSVLPSTSPTFGGLSRVASTTRSSKSRKTVSWSDGHDQQLSISVFPASFSSSSVIGEYGDETSLFSRPFLEGRGLPSTSSQHYVDNTPVVIASTGTTIESGEKSVDNANAQSVQEIITTALAEMQAMMAHQMSAMQSEMQRLFREQRDELQKLRVEITSVKQENEKLRNTLFQSTGIRDSVRRNTGVGATTH
jgi:hypothetical protein